MGERECSRCHDTEWVGRGIGSHSIFTITSYGSQYLGQCSKCGHQGTYDGSSNSFN